MCAVLCGFPYLRSMATQFHHTLSTMECCLAVSSNSELFPHFPSFPPLPLPLLSSPLTLTLSPLSAGYSVNPRCLWGWASPMTVSVASSFIAPPVPPLTLCVPSESLTLTPPHCYRPGSPGGAGCRLRVHPAEVPAPPQQSQHSLPRRQADLQGAGLPGALPPALCGGALRESEACTVAYV